MIEIIKKKCQFHRQPLVVAENYAFETNVLVETICLAFVYYVCVTK